MKVCHSFHGSWLQSNVITSRASNFLVKDGIHWLFWSRTQCRKLMKPRAGFYNLLSLTWMIGSRENPILSSRGTWSSWCRVRLRANTGGICRYRGVLGYTVHLGILKPNTLWVCNASALNPNKNSPINPVFPSSDLSGGRTLLVLLIVLTTVL